MKNCLPRFRTSPSARATGSRSRWFQALATAILFERDVEAVRADVLNEHLTIDEARIVYGTILEEGSFAIDYDATERTRRAYLESR